LRRAGDRDGQLDAAVTSASQAVLAILHGRGDGTFAPRIDYKVGPGPTTPVIADIDHDGLPDLLTVNDDVLQVLTATCRAR
jgi:hypothetical protein